MDLSGYPKLSIRGTIGPKNAMMGFFGEDDVFSASDCSKFLEDNADADTIVVDISSPGGSVYEGFEIYDMLKGCGKEVITTGTSVNSIAVVVFLAGSKRFISENASFVVHLVRIDPMNLGMNPLTAEDLYSIAADIEETNTKIINLYCKVLGEEKRSLMLALMAKEGDIGPKDAIKYGFASGYTTTGGKKKEAEKSAKLKNICIEQSFINLMEATQVEKINSLGSKLDGILNMFTKFKNFILKNEVTLELEGGKKLYVHTDTEDLVGKRAVEVDEAGLPTETDATAGEHKLSDGRVIVVGEAGIISEVKEAIDVEALSKELVDEKAAKEELVNQLKEKDELIAAKDAEMKGVLLEVQNLKLEFENFKKEVPGDPDKKVKPAGKVTAEQLQNMSNSQKLLLMRKGEL